MGGDAHQATYKKRKKGKAKMVNKFKLKKKKMQLFWFISIFFLFACSFLLNIVTDYCNSFLF